MSRKQLFAMTSLLLLLGIPQGCAEPEPTPEVTEIGKEAPPASVEARLTEAAKPAAEQVHTVGSVPVPRLAKVTFENQGTYNLSVTQTVDQLRTFYQQRGYKPVDHPEGFAVFVSEKGPIIQVLRGVGPRCEIVIIEKVVSDAPPPVEEALAPKTPEELEQLQKRLRSDEPTENLPHPPARDL